MARWNDNHTRKTWAFTVCTASGRRTSFTLSNPKDIQEALRLAEGSSSTASPSKQLIHFVSRAAADPEIEQASTRRGAFSKLVRAKLFKMLKGAYRPEIAKAKEEHQSEEEYFDEEAWRASPEFIHGVNNGFIDPETGKYKE